MIEGRRLKLEGVYSVLPTPFLATGDFASLRRVLDLLIAFIALDRVRAFTGPEGQ